jgi:hypothetical protein
MHIKATRNPEKKACHGILPGSRKATAHAMNAAVNSNAGITQDAVLIVVLLFIALPLAAFLIST